MYKHRRRRIFVIFLNFFLQWVFIIFLTVFSFPAIWTPLVASFGGGDGVGEDDDGVGKGSIGDEVFGNKGEDAVDEAGNARRFSSRGGFVNLTLEHVVDLSLDPRIGFWIWLSVAVAQQSWIIYSIVSIVRKGSKGIFLVSMAHPSNSFVHLSIKGA